MGRAEALRHQETFSKNALPTYDSGFDIKAYAGLRKLRGTPEFLEKRRQLDGYVFTQMETHLAERLNVILTTTEYKIKDGQMYGQGMDEPFIDSIQRGIQYSRLHGNPVDFPREEAELKGFSKTQSILTDPETPVGTTIVSISPRSENEESRYTHNFYDVFTLEEGENGRNIKMRRYSSALTAVESVQRISSLSSEPTPLPTAESLLANPILIDQSKAGSITPEDIHKYLHKNHQCLSEEEFRQIRTVCGFFINDYIENLATNPLNEKELEKSFNAVLNKAQRMKEGEEKYHPQLIRQYENPFFVKKEIDILGMLPVKKVMTGCGSSAGFVNGLSPVIENSLEPGFSVSDLSSKKEWFRCPKCGHQASGPVGNQCPGCGITKDEYALESGLPSCA